MKLKKIISLVTIALGLIGCNKNDYYVLTERNFFLVMTNIQYYPEQYVNKTIEYDCFTYELNSINNNSFICGVRKCSSGVGCTCGKDTIIGFILDTDLDIPKPKNQSEDTNDKTWVHIKGHLETSEKQKVQIHSYKDDGTIDEQKNETVSLLKIQVSECFLIEDYSNLNYYVTK